MEFTVKIRGLPVRIVVWEQGGWPMQYVAYGFCPYADCDDDEEFSSCDHLSIAEAKKGVKRKIEQHLKIEHEV